MYRIRLTPRAEKQIKGLPKSVKKRVKKKLIGMREVPFAGDVKKLKMKDARYRCRVGDYRIIFDIDKKSNTISILTARHRKDVYR